MSRDLGFPTPTCNKDECPRNGQTLRWNAKRQPAIKGTDQTTVINVFLCEQYGPQKTLHTHYTGPNGEAVERLDGHGSYRYRDNVTGQIVETFTKRKGWKISEEGLERIREAKRTWWTPERREQAREEMSDRAKGMWSDPDTAARLTEANHLKSADPEYRMRMSQAHLNLSPEKQRNKSEGVRKARLRERALIAAVSKGRASDPIFEKAHNLKEQGFSWARVTIKLLPEEYRDDPEKAVSRIKQGVRYYKKNRLSRTGRGR